jgi:hypothetical protein
MAVVALSMTLVLGACAEADTPEAESTMATAAPGVATPETAGGTAMTGAADADEAEEAEEAEEAVLEFDVSENATKFSFQQEPVLPDGLPAYGNPFITQGYIYPSGTLTATNGVLANGDPEFPDKVIGLWVCRGWFFGSEGADTKTGPIVATTQIYQLSTETGATTLVSDGFEVVDADVPVNRAITGGTGEYSEADGEATQTLLGLNPTQGVNLHFSIKTTK